jgi:hypothetical protein
VGPLDGDRRPAPTHAHDGEPLRVAAGDPRIAGDADQRRPGDVGGEEPARRAGRRLEAHPLGLRVRRPDPEHRPRARQDAARAQQELRLLALAERRPDGVARDLGASDALDARSAADELVERLVGADAVLGF